MEGLETEGVPVNIFVKRGLTPADMISTLEIAGLYDTSVPNHLRIIFGKVATREVIPQIAEVAGVEYVMEDVAFYPVLESQ